PARSDRDSPANPPPRGDPRGLPRRVGGRGRPPPLAPFHLFLKPTGFASDIRKAGFTDSSRDTGWDGDDGEPAPLHRFPPAPALCRRVQPPVLPPARRQGR